MSVRPDHKEKTGARTTVPTIRRAPRPIHAPSWPLPAAAGVLVVVAVILGVALLRPGEDTTTPTPLEPLVGPEEQAFIDAKLRAPWSGAQTADSPAVVAPPVRPTGVPGVLDYYESEFVLDRVPGAQLPSPASVGFPQLVDEYEQAYIDTHTALLTPQAPPLAPISVRPTGVPGLLDYYESEFVLDRVPGAQLPSPASVGFPQLVDEYEQAFIDGEYRHPNDGASTWCDTHMPC